MVEFKAENHILINSAPFKKVVPLQHVTNFDRIVLTTVRKAPAFVKQLALFRDKKAGDDGQEGGFTDSVIVETFERQLVIKLKIFKGMSSSDTVDMENICGRLRYALKQKKVSGEQAARDLGVSRDLVLAYTNYSYPEDSMQVKYLIKFAEYFGEERYYFCNEYHRFLDTVEVDRLLRESRKERKMTQREFADHLGVPIYRYKSYEQGRCRITREVFDLLKNKINLEQ